jgi:hypothetical protein
VSQRELELLCLIKLMQEEIECLRSVLSEWESEKTCYIQFNRAEIFKDARESLEHKL